MARKTKYGNGFFAFVHDQGLVINDDVSFAAAKKKYLADCKRRSKQEIRKRCKVFEILLSTQELKTVEQKAKEIKVSTTRFIKMAALSKDAMINPVTIGKIRQLLMEHYNYLQAQFEEVKIGEDVSEKILSQTEETEGKILGLLHD